MVGPEAVVGPEAAAGPEAAVLRATVARGAASKPLVRESFVTGKKGLLLGGPFFLPAFDVPAAGSRDPRELSIGVYSRATSDDLEER